MTLPSDLAPVADVPGAFAAAVAAAFEARSGPTFTLVLSGGETARACYERLAASSGVDWSLTTLLIGDERLVPAGDPDANQRLIHESLLDRIGPVRAFLPMPTDGNPDDCAASYQQTVAATLATDGFDVVHLGLGPDGHTASLFPGSSALGAGPDVLVMANTDPSGRNPHPRLTLTLPAIAQARLALFTVTGAEKQAAVDAVRAGDDIPADRVTAQRVAWLIDVEAFGDGRYPAPGRGSPDRRGPDQEDTSR